MAAESRPSILSVAAQLPSYVSPGTCGRRLIAHISCSYITRRAGAETFSLSFLQKWASSSDLKVPEKKHLMVLWVSRSPTLKAQVAEKLSAHFHNTNVQYFFTSSG